MKYLWLPGLFAVVMLATEATSLRADVAPPSHLWQGTWQSPEPKPRAANLCRESPNHPVPAPYSASVGLVSASRELASRGC
jgi:hypothetical protein